MGENTTKFEYKSYTTEMISILLSAADERGKVMILLMASTGMRVSALQDIKLKHLKKCIIDDQGTYIYQITVYVNSKKNKYFAFCTPECAKAIDNYILLRKRYGENIKQDSDGNWVPAASFLFVSQFNKDGNHLITNPKRILRRTFSRYIVVLLEQTGLRKRYRITEIDPSLKNGVEGINSYEKQVILLKTLCGYLPFLFS